MIAHVGGLPLEETVAQLAPAGAAALVALGPLIVRARLRVAELRHRDSPPAAGEPTSPAADG